MEQIINFRATIDAFNEYEFALFCTKMYQQYNKRQLIIKSLFHLFIDESKHNKYENVTKINTIVTNIMDLRKKKQLISESTVDTNNAQITINNVPSPLLAHIASYLILSQQTSLIKCNRYICSSLLSSPSRILCVNEFWYTLYKDNHGP
eukprot:244443_1